VKLRVGVLACNLLGQEVAADSFAVRRMAAFSCNVSTTALDFGSVPAQLAQAVDQTASVTVNNSDNVAVTVAY
jgi:spore coat protein U-like protein